MQTGHCGSEALPIQSDQGWLLTDALADLIFARLIVCTALHRSGWMPFLGLANLLMLCPGSS